MVETITAIYFTKEEFNLLKCRPQYSIEKQGNNNVLNTIIDTENAIKQLNNDQQNVFRHLAAKKIKHILYYKAENNHLHKRQ
jgi:hypothetical protein